MTHGSLFAGIGGFDLGFARAGLETVWQVEIDDYCRKVLAQHCPAAERFADIRECGKHNLKPVDIISGGFPCQDISNAGERAGIDGERSGLWREMHRIIGELRPEYVVVENVAALLGRGMGRVLGDLAASGYDAEWDCLRAYDVGAPHLRDRVFIVAYAARQCFDGSRIAGEGRRFESSNRRAHVADADQPRLEGRDCGVLPECTGEFTAGSASSSIRRFDWWDVEPDVGRVAHGISVELDFIGRLNADSNGKKTKSEINVLVRNFLREVWKHRELAKTSPDLYRKRLHDLVPGMPQEGAYGGWLLGKRIEEDQELCNLWCAFYAASFEESHDMQSELLKRIGQKKRPEALGSRVDRLRGLGNAVVPQIAEWIGTRIMEHRP